MLEPKFKLGQVLTLIEQEINHESVVGFVAGIKVASQYDGTTKKNHNVFAYLLSGHDKWYYETAVTLAVKENG